MASDSDSDAGSGSDTGRSQAGSTADARACSPLLDELPARAEDPALLYNALQRVAVRRREGLVGWVERRERRGVERGRGAEEEAEGRARLSRPGERRDWHINPRRANSAERVAVRVTVDHDRRPGAHVEPRCRP